MRELSPAQQLARQLARTQRFSLGVPSQFTVTGDGAAVLFLRSRAGDDPVSCLWRLDLGSGQERLLADPATLTAGRPAGKPAGQELPEEERTRRERARQQGSGIVSYATDAAATLAAFTVSGVLHAVAATGGQVRRLPAVATDPRPDPAGQRIGYVRDGALRVIEADGTADRAGRRAGRPGRHVRAGRARRRRVDGPAPAATGGPRTATGCWSPGWTAPRSPAGTSRTRPPRPAAPRRPLPSRPARPTPRSRCGCPPRRHPDRGRLGPGPRSSTWPPRAGTHRGPYAAVQSRDQRTVQLLGIDPADGRPPCCWPSSATNAGCSWFPDCPPAPRPARWSRTPTGRHPAPDRRRRPGHPARPAAPRRARRRRRRGAVHRVRPTRPQAHLWSYRPGHGARPAQQRARRAHRRQRAARWSTWPARADRPGGRVTVEPGGRGPAVPIASLAERPVLNCASPARARPRANCAAMLFLPSWHSPWRRPGCRYCSTPTRVRVAEGHR